MPVAITFKTTGAWGVGSGAEAGGKLSDVQVDNNFYNLKLAVEALQTDRPQPNNITSINVTATAMTFYFQDGSTIGPLPLPVLMFRFRGELTNGLVLQILDTFTVAEVGLFATLVDNTAVLPFDPAAVDGDGNALYQMLLPVSSGATTLDELTDVTLTSPADRQILTFDEGSGQWVNGPVDLAVAGLSDVLIGSLADGQMIQWNATAGKWVNVDPPGGSVATLSDVDHTNPPTDQQVLRFLASSGKWVPMTLSGGGGGGSVLNPRGDWISGTVYAPNDVSRDGAGFYVAFLGVGGTTPPHSDPTHWAQVSILDSTALDAAFATDDSDEGTILVRGGAGLWLPLPPGAAGLFLKAQGPGAPLVYAAPALSDLAEVDLTGLADGHYLRYDLAGASFLPTFDGAFRSLEVIPLDGVAALIEAQAYGAGVTFAGRRAAGTRASPTAAAATAVLAAFIGQGWDGSAWPAVTAAAGLQVIAAENQTGSAHGARLALLTIPIGSTTAAVRWLIEPDGGIISASGITGGSQGAGSINLSGGFYINGDPVVGAANIAGTLDAIGNDQGMILVRGASGWVALAPGTAGYVLSTGGVAADPAWVANTSGITQLTGDVAAGPGSGSQTATIASNVVTNAKLAQMAAHRFKGNNTGSTADPLDLTAAQLTAELSAVVGDTGSGGTKGLAPAPGAGDAAAGKYLDAAGGYSVPPGAVPGWVSFNDDSGPQTFGEVVYTVSGTELGFGVFDDGVATPETYEWTTEALKTYFVDTNTPALQLAQAGSSSFARVWSFLVKSEDVAAGTTSSIDNYVSSQSGTASFPHHALRQARGTEASPTAVQSGNYLGQRSWYGWDGSGWGLGVTLRAIATENWTGSAHGAKLQASVTPNGTTSPLFAFEIDQDGNLRISSGLVFTQSTAPYPFAISAPQTTAYGVSQVIGAHRMACAGQIPANFGSYGGMATTAGGSALATGATVISIERSVAATPLTFTQIGTVTIGAGTAGVSAKATAGGVAISLAADDIVRAVMPSSPDATFAGAMLTIIARRT